ncbi:glycosyltransferase [Erysipelotrichaceae bacterium Oil+RF-744-GAM-WT-6]|uniref:Glycosyltransferase n=1 Tax=Stecheria intestinalis TaxID=2606630 RepID=A0A7X2NU12_9FIRM|nr:sugar transferase [Stecheria intestinalis]MSS59514.1 glycosyltransferase [Stecheria intestinalis]
MSKKKLNIAAGIIVAGIASVATVAAIADQREQRRAKAVAERNGVKIRKPSSIYEQYVKRPLDAVLSTGATVVLSPVLGITALTVKKKLGSPVLFTQERPGQIDSATGKEKIFKLYKFRTMTDERDEDGNLLPDEVRLTKFGAWLRSTSLDELPELFNIIKGDMAVIGPRPQLVRDMVFMTDEQRQRHSVRPGLSGLAQVRGRNAISWEGKLSTDLEYIKKITFTGDAKIVGETISKVFAKEGITEEGQATALDFGDELLKEGKVDQDTYDEKQAEAKEILKEKVQDCVPGLVSVIMPSYNTAPYIAKSIESVLRQTYRNLELIIVDDCSTDNTDEVVESFSDPRIHYFHNEKNSGAAVSRNKALREAKGQWIAFLDSDDLWVPEKLERQIAFMEKNGYKFSYTGYQEIDGNGHETGAKISGPKKITHRGMVDYCWPGCLTVMYDSSVVGLIQIPDIKKNNDYAMWLEVSKKADCYFLPEFLAKYRRGRSGSVSTHSIKTMIGWHYKLWHEAEGENAIQSLWNTGKNMVCGLYKKNRYVIS